MSFQTEVMDLLKEKTMSVQEINRNLGISLNYTRTQLRLMETAGLITRVDERTPIIYKLADNNPLVQHREAIVKRKKQLLSKDDSKEGLMKLIKATPKEQWPAVAITLDIVSAAIKELESEGMLIDIL